MNKGTPEDIWKSYIIRNKLEQQILSRAFKEQGWSNSPWDTDFLSMRELAYPCVIRYNSQHKCVNFLYMPETIQDIPHPIVNFTQILKDLSYE